MESAVYDPIQRWMAVDAYGDLRYRSYEEQLQGLHGIHLDDTFIDPETYRVRRDRLAKLLEQVATIPDIRAVFLDFLFYPAPNSSDADSVLTDALRKWQDKVVLPYEIHFEPLPVFSTVAAKAVAVDSQLVYRPPHMGYLAPLVLVGDETYRYHQQTISGTSAVSAARALLKATIGPGAALLTRQVPQMFEINYLVRNRPTPGLRPALRISDASAVQSWTAAERAEQFQGSKLVFIGLFYGRQNKYGQLLDVFRTPVDPQLPGIYLPINLYLNFTGGAYFRRASWWLVFLVNLVLGIGSACYYFWVRRFSAKPLVLILGELLVVGLSFTLFLLVLYQWWYTKFPFVITTIILVSNQFFASWYFRNKTRLL